MKALLAAIAMLSAGFAFAQSVDRDEFTDIINRTIQFQNYAGRYDRVDTLDQILEIGRGLGRFVQPAVTSNGSLGDKYRILHILGTPAEKGKGADILILLPNAGVDHIDNIRRILSSYLSQTYKYAKADADVLSVFITVYNAVHRGNLQLFQSRYKASVTKELSAERVGLALSYTEWAGKTQIVIPLSIAAASTGPGGNLAAVATADLVTPEVVATVRDQPGSGTDQRQQLANLMDRAVDQERDNIQRERDRLTEEQNALNNQNGPSPTATPGAGPGVTTTPANTPAPGTSGGSGNTQAAQNQNTPGTTPASTGGNAAQNNSQNSQNNQQNNTSTQQNIDNQQAQLNQREAETNELEQASNQLRQETAADLGQQNSTTAAAATPVVLLKARLENAIIVGTLQRINPSSGEVLAESATSLKVIGRHLVDFADSYLAAVVDGGNAKLVLLGKEKLDETKRSSATVAQIGDIVVLPGGNEFLAVIQDNGEWYLGRFDRQLNSPKRSDIPVDPVGAIVVQGNLIFVQTKVGKLSPLSLTDLSTAQ